MEAHRFLDPARPCSLPVVPLRALGAESLSLRPFMGHAGSDRGLLWAAHDRSLEPVFLKRDYYLLLFGPTLGGLGQFSCLH